MDLIEHTIRTAWRHRVLFTDHVFDPANSALREMMAGDEPDGLHRALVLLDESLAAAQPALAAAITAYFVAHADGPTMVQPPLLVEGGEGAKNACFHLCNIHAAINRHHIDRHSFLVTVGGGALLDLAGLAASTAHRGVRHVRVPSTTLSQCDSGVGVKNGINAFGKKNFIGTFSPPFAVINDFQLLATLTPRDKLAGYAEAVKVACIRDSVFFQALERDAPSLCRFEAEPMRRLIRRCAELHLSHIAESGDPFETGSARPLDFGHWAAHKLEQLSNFSLRHGEAVAIGIALDVIYSRHLGCLNSASAERVLQLLETLGFGLFTPELLYANASRDLHVLQGLKEFREHLGGRLAITLLREIGSGFEVHEMDEPRVIESILELQERHVALERKRIPPASRR